MSTDFRIFLVSPANIIVYSFDDPKGKGLIYNAGSLEYVDSSIEITGFTEIKGTVTKRFGVNPVVLGYDNNTLEIVYAPEKIPYIFKSDGSPAQSDQGEVIVRASILIPDLKKSTISEEVSQLTKIPLQNFNESSLTEYIRLSQKKRMQKTKENFFDSQEIMPPSSIDKDNQPEKVSILTTESMAMPMTHIDESPIIVPEELLDPKQEYNNADNVCPIKSPSPRIIPEKPHEFSLDPFIEELFSAQQDTSTNVREKDLAQIKEEIAQLQMELKELEGIVKAMNQRLYRIYPVDCPNKLRVDGKMVQLIDVAEIKKRMSDNEIERFSMEPHLQAYAGSYRSNNRMLTFYAKDGNIYLVRADYDAKTNKINPPQ